MNETEKKWEDCMVVNCDQKGGPRVCPGDGRSHGHGAIHTVDSQKLGDLDLGPWGWLCAEHYEMADAEWTSRRAAVNQEARR